MELAYLTRFLIMIWDPASPGGPKANPSLLFLVIRLGVASNQPRGAKIREHLQTKQALLKNVLFYSTRIQARTRIAVLTMATTGHHNK